MDQDLGRVRHVETVIIGGGQAGLSVGYHLSKRGREYVILDANDRIGDSWRRRWDSLRVFTPAWVDGLPGFPFPAARWSFPTKDELGDYFETYATRFDLPVETSITVESVSKEGDRFVVVGGGRRIEADNVVIATGACLNPTVPSFATELDANIVQFHSSEYRNPTQLRDGKVLLVGAGNSGAEIARELSPTRPTWLAGQEPGHIPARHGSIPFRALFRVIRFMGHRVLTVSTPIGRKVRPKFLARGAPLIRVRPKDLSAAGVNRVGRVTGTKDGKPLLDGDQVLDVENVIWCTGFHYDFSWIKFPISGAAEEPEQVRGVVANEPGLYFMGLLFQYAATSDVLPGVGRDAEYVANHIASRQVGSAMASA